MNRRKRTVGFVFDFQNRHLGTSRSIGADEMARIPRTKRCILSAWYIHCVRCDLYMDYVKGPRADVDGKWVCPVCGSSVKESTAMKKMWGEIDTLDKMLND